ncbi:DNA cytosine methyltransferase [Hoylesella buccalis ATCC 35310]|nr:DNA cytosine methyltransferase [Hoylesella buccalis ATCC 35310]
MEFPQIMRSERTEFGKSVRKEYERHELGIKRQDMRIWRPRKDGVSNCITTLTKDNIMIEQKRNKGKLITEEVAVKLKLPKEYVGKRFRIRKLTPRECFRLMDVDEEKTDKLLNAKNEKGLQLISNSQLYKLAGNSIVVSCMEYMFRNLFIGVPEEEKRKQEPVQLKLF